MLEGNAIVSQKWEPGMITEDFDNTKINIWVHIYRLPYKLRYDKYPISFAELAVAVHDTFGGGRRNKVESGGEFLKYRVKVDTSKPLLPGFFLRRSGRKQIWVYMKYERLPNICFHCGKMTHDTRKL